jgi:hypothetical protein
MRQKAEEIRDVPEPDWVPFQGGELEGRRPRALCQSCRDALRRAATMGADDLDRFSPQRPLCFQCYRVDLDRQRAIRAAGDLDTASAERFQSQLPFEPLNRPRLEMLKIARTDARAATPAPVDKRRRAQIEARHALQQLAAGLEARGLAAVDRERAIFEVVRAAELQLPESWLPFVVSR